MDDNPEQLRGLKADQSSPGPSRKRSRASSDDEDRVVEEKRIKARERQRRKRERDRSGRDKSSSTTIGGPPFPSNHSDPSQPMTMYSPEDEQQLANGRGRAGDLSAITPEEAAKKDRIRTAARERQRKHRAAVKAKRMAELGMTVVSPSGGVDGGPGYTVNEQGYIMDDPNGSHHHPMHEPPFPVLPPHASPGQTFASTLMLAISCSVVLKQHLFRTLHITEEELASFEPVIAAAWDHWDHERALHYAAAAANATSEHPAPPPTTSYLPPHPPQHTHGHMYPLSDFRARFHRPLVAPFPSSAPGILRPEGSVVHPANGSATTNGSYADPRDRDDGDSDGQDDPEHDEGRSPPPAAAAAIESIDPALEAGGTSDVRGERLNEAQAGAASMGGAQAGPADQRQATPA